MVDVTIITAVYGDDYDHFIPGWIEAVNSLTLKPKRIIMGSDKVHQIAIQNGIDTVLDAEPETKWRSPFFWNKCAQEAKTKWVWVLDIDDRFRPDALEGLEKQDCDIWLVGMAVNGRDKYLPPHKTNEEIFTEPHCSFCCGSPIQKSWLEKCSYPEVAFADWAMWRKSARLGAKFGWANKVAYDYRHDFANSMSGWADADHRNRLAVLEL